MKPRKVYLLFKSIARILLLFALFSCSTPASTPTPFPDVVQEIVQVGEYKMPIFVKGKVSQPLF